MCIIYSIYIFQSEKLLTLVERAKNFTYSGVKTQKCQNFQIDHYNSQRLISEVQKFLDSQYIDADHKLYWTCVAGADSVAGA